jgi:hypothetical protein
MLRPLELLSPHLVFFEQSMYNMNNLTINEVVKFFESLDLIKKVEMLTELTDALNKGIKEEAAIDERKVEDEDGAIIALLFGAWAEEEGLYENSIIDRTVSEREINLG